MDDGRGEFKCPTCGAVWPDRRAARDFWRRELSPSNPEEPGRTVTTEELTLYLIAENPCCPAVLMLTDEQRQDLDLDDLETKTPGGPMPANPWDLSTHALQFLAGTHK